MKISVNARVNLPLSLGRGAIQFLSKRTSELGVRVGRPFITHAQSHPASTGLSAASPSTRNTNPLRAFRFNPWPIGAFILMLVLVSCDKKSLTVQNESSDTTAAIYSQQSLAPDTIPEDIKIFWGTFRQTVISSDSAALKLMVQFPLQTHGFSDYDPQPLISSGKFYQAFKKTTIEYIRTTEKLGNRTVGGFTEDWFRVSDYQFSKIDGKWKLSLIYFDTRNN